MIYRGVRMNITDEKKKDRRDLLKAAVIAVLTVAVVGGAVYLTLQLGI